MENIYLEFPYNILVSNYSNIFRPNKNGVVNELDILLFNYNLDLNECYLFEIKYHRQKNSSSPKPEKAGSILNDIERLHIINNNVFKNINIRKFFVYLTDLEMIDYFNRNAKNNSFLDFYFKNSKNINFDYITSNCSNTFKDAARKSFNSNYSDPNDYEIKEFYCGDFMRFNSKLKIYEIIDETSILNDQNETRGEDKNNSNKGESVILQKLKKVTF